jgi:LysM repeat protein
MRKSLICIFLGANFSLLALQQKPITQSEYVGLWSNIAVKHMHQYGIPASITLAQGILESGNGNSPLAIQGNNHFGIKCHDWTGEKIYFDDDAKGECFRKYASAEDSYNDHSTFLKGKSRYASLFEYPKDDYQNWAKGLKKAGYATHPQYAEKLIDLIERLRLFEYDEKTAQDAKGTELLATNAKSEQNKSSNAMKIDEAALSYKPHDVKVHKNDIKYVVARKGDTYYKISKELKVGMWQLYKYNNFGPKKDLLEEGDIVYIEPKRNKSRTKNDVFVAKTSITLIEISQREGIKLKKLVKINGYTSDKITVEKGQKVLLR